MRFRSPIQRGARQARAVLCALTLLSASAAWAADFRAPEKITDGAERYRLSRLSNSTAAFDSSGTLHVAYWSGQEETSPASPSRIYYRAWTEEGGWSAQEAIDDSESEGQHVGGRHPSLVATREGAVWVVWHDHRHGAPGGTYQDNIEIYGDFKPKGGAFSSADVRFTSAAGNGYAPKIALDPDGSLSLCWYDFHYNSNISDIFMRTSDANGAFNLSAPMDAIRLTNYADRGGAQPSTPAYALPDLAIDASGARHFVWGGGFGVGGGLYYAHAPRGAAAVSPQLLDPAGWDYYDPAHIAVAANGDVWIAYGKENAGAAENVVLLRKRAGQSAFAPPVTISPNAARQYAPDIEADANGKVHLVWIDWREGRDVFYGCYDPASGRLTDETALTRRDAVWERPTLALSGEGRIAVLFEESPSISTGDIWFVRDAPPPACVGAERWIGYE